MPWGQPSPWIDSIRARISLSLSPPPPAELRGGGRPGAHRPDSLQRGREGPRPPRLPVRGLAGDGEDVDGEDPRTLTQLRARADPDAVRRMRALPDDRRGHFPRRDRDGQGQI